MADSAYNFLPLATTAPSFTSIVSTLGTAFRLETSTTSARAWGSPTNRFVRITGVGVAEDMWMIMGTTVAVPTSGTATLLLMPDTYIFPIQASNPGISFLCPSSSASQVNVTVGTIVDY